MTQLNDTPQSNQNGSIQRMHELTLAILYMLLSIFTQPFEIFLRPWYGTRYFDPLISMGACMLMLMLPLVAEIPDMVRSMIPFTRMHNTGPTAVIGLGGMASLFFLATFLHSLRIWWLMLHPEKEPHSEFVGRSVLPFFRLLPKGKSFEFCRIVYEPLTLIVGSILLSDFNILTLGAARYTFFAGICLSAKNSIEWYKRWLFFRVMLDAKFAGPIIAAMIEGNATDDEVNSINMAGFPKNLPPEIKTAALAHVTATLSPETARLVSPVEKPTKPEASRLASVVQPLAGLLICIALTLTPMCAQTPATPALAYVTNSLDASVSVIDLNAQKVIATIPVGMTPYALQITPDGRFLYTINRGDGSLGTNAGSDISVVSTAANKVVKTINLNNPDGFAIAGVISNDGSKLYVSNGSTNPAGRIISVVSTASNTVIASIKLGDVYPHALAISPDDKTLLVASQDGQDLVEISTVTNTITRSIGLYNLQRHPDGGPTGMGNPEGMVFLPGTHKAYVVSYGGDTFGWLDMETGKMAFPKTFRPRNFSLTAIAAVPATNNIYVAAGDNGIAFEIDTTTDTLIDSGGISPNGKVLYVGGTPSSIAVRSDSTLAYIVNSSSNDVSIIDIKKNQAVGSIKVGRAPTWIVLEPGPNSGPPLSFQDQPPAKPTVSGIPTTVMPQGVPAPVTGTPAVAVTPPAVAGKPSLPNCPVVVTPQPPVTVNGPWGTKLNVPFHFPPIHLGSKSKVCQ